MAEEIAKLAKQTDSRLLEGAESVEEERRALAAVEKRFAKETKEIMKKIMRGKNYKDKEKSGEGEKKKVRNALKETSGPASKQGTRTRVIEPAKQVRTDAPKSRPSPAVKQLEKPVPVTAPAPEIKTKQTPPREATAIRKATESSQSIKKTTHLISP